MSETARRQPARRPGACQRARLHVGRVGAGPFVQPAALARVVDDGVDRDDRPRPCALDTERRSLPEHRAVGVDDACRVEHLAAREPVVEAAGEPEGHDLPVGQRALAPMPTSDRAGAELARGALLGLRGAGQRHPVNVQAMLRTVSLMLDVAANAAAGSKPQWIAQCSQRGSLPGPYISHSMPSISAS